MAVVSLFSKRRKAAAKAGQPDVFTYDDLPTPFRVQVAHIWNDLLGHYNSLQEVNARWVFMHNAFAREKGVFALTQDHDHQSRCINYLLKCSTDDALDFIELVFRAMDNICGDKPDWHLENLYRAPLCRFPSPPDRLLKIQRENFRISITENDMRVNYSLSCAYYRAVDVNTALSVHIFSRDRRKETCGNFVHRRCYSKTNSLRLADDFIETHFHQPSRATP